MAANADILRRIPLFSGLGDEDLALVYRLASTHTFKRGTVIFCENDPGDALHVIVSGTVKIYRLTDDGREKTLAFMGKGEFFGEMALLDGSARSAVAEALVNTRTLAIYRTDFEQLLAEHPRLAVEIIKVLSRRLRDTNAQLMDVIFRDARGRVASALVELTRKHGTPAAGGMRIELRLTHQELASLVGTARETVSRILAEFQNEQLLHIDGRCLVVPNLGALAAIAE